MRAGLKSLVVPAVLTCVALAVLISLGNWQVRRLAWKEDLIARVRERPSREPLDLRGRDLSRLGDIDAFLQNNEYAPVLLSGEYRPDGEVRVFTSLSEPRGPLGGPGYWVLTPFVTAPGGAAVLVNRGFVPDGRLNAYDPPPGGEQAVEGLVRAPEKGSWLTPDPKREESTFFSRDPARIAETMGIEGVVSGFFIDLDASYTPLSGLPQAGETRMTFPNTHLQYAVTWYGLAAVLLAVFAVSGWQRLKEPQGERLTRAGRHH
jgi:surfeit locus 1 family protein